MNTSSKAQGSAPSFFSLQVAEARRFYLELKPTSAKALVVACGGVERSAPDYVIDRPSFPFCSVEYVLGGRGQLRLQDKSYTLKPGVVFAYGPGVSQHIQADQGEPLLKYFVDFSGRRALNLMGRCDLRPGTVSQVYPASELQPLFDELIRCGLRAAPGTARLCAAILECLMLKLVDARTPGESADSLSFQKYQACREYIQAHFARLKTLQQVSAECHVSDAYLCRLFRRYERQSPYRFLLRLKMNRAAAILQRPEVLVKQAAEEAGFDDPFHFSRAFKAVFGLSPDAFRRLR